MRPTFDEGVNPVQAKFACDKRIKITIFDKFNSMTTELCNGWALWENRNWSWSFVALF